MRLVVDILDELAISPVPGLLLILGEVIVIFIEIKWPEGLGAGLFGFGFVIGALLILGGGRIIVSGSFGVARAIRLEYLIWVLPLGISSCEHR